MKLIEQITGFDPIAHNRGWVRWHKSPSKTLTCPACHKTRTMTSRLDVASPAHRFHRFTLFECPDCQSGHFPTLHPPAYEAEQSTNFAARKYYIEQGAGFEAMFRPFFRINQQPIKTLLEVGCGYGFSLHFAREALGWEPIGYDPSSLATHGANDLGLDIHPQYLNKDTAVQVKTADLVYGSELVEHLADPDPLLSLIHDLVGDKGTLILTTPNIAALDPARALEAHLSLISPGSHLVLYSKDGLRQALNRAGFAHVHLQADQNSLLVIASNAPLALTVDRPLDRKKLCQYLQTQTGQFAKHTILFSGFTGRWFKELVNAGTYAQADLVLDQLATHWQEQYGLDVRDPSRLDLPIAPDETIKSIASKLPFNLVLVLYHGGVLALNADQDTQRAETYFHATIRSYKVMQPALHQANVVDLESRKLAGLAQIRLIELAISPNLPLAAQRLQQLEPEQLTDEDQAAMWQVKMQVFAQAANTGQWDIARPLAEPIAQKLHDKTNINEYEKAAITGLAMLALNHHQNRKEGLFWLDKLLTGPPGAGLQNLRKIWKEQARVHGTEILADGGHEALRPIADEIRGALAHGTPQKPDLDLLVALGHIDQRTDPANAIVWFERAICVANGDTKTVLGRLLADTKIQGFLAAVAGDKPDQAKKFRALLGPEASLRQGPPALWLALGLDTLNRLEQAGAALPWLRKAADCDDDLVCNDAKDVMVIAQRRQMDVQKANGAAR
ncbi:MAG: hypothetical protein COA47_09335 [Robiginitomaculum sp.]|nr:MAG: hypothetical protein COA47_09335 [Robiginitomaculum sp.]